MKTLADIRSAFFGFYRERGHTIIPSASLVPQNDPTTLFTGSGMQPLVPYLLGKDHPEGKRLANSQRSFRAEDVEEVGDNRHTTFFEMLGNWSLGDYFKKEQLPFIFSFLVDEVGLKSEKLYVTVFAGDEANNLPKDTESAEIWKHLFAEKGIDAVEIEMGSEADGARLGMRGGRIFYYDAKKNWWSRAGVPANMPGGEPGGPDSEVFYDFGTEHDPKFGENCHPNCDCGRFMEIGNSVFMQYQKTAGGFAFLPKKNVDFGGGLERIAAAANNNPDVFATDVFADAIALLEKFSGKQYADSRYQKSFRVIADHVRAALFMIADGVRPSNTEQGYVLRRLLRRASQHVMKLGLEDKDKEDSMLVRSAIIFMEKYASAYPELATEEMYQTVTDTIWEEEKQFARILTDGIKILDKAMADSGRSPITVRDVAHNSDRIIADPIISAGFAFELVTTRGLPRELVEEYAKEKGYIINYGAEELDQLLEQHKNLSRSGAEQKFKGGLADTSEATTRLHTAHHLLLKGLQIVLGDHVKQRGSNITSERLRIDFSHPEKMTDEQKKEVERIVNERIKEHLPMIRSTMPKEEAEKLNAQHEFGAKYPDVVSVYSLGPVGATEENPQFDRAFSIEFCGGPHVSNTEEIEKGGTFKIQKEEAVAAGVRRIKGILAH